MNLRLLRAFETLRPEFKRTWERQLRAAGATSALALPDLLVPMMDNTIAELLHVAHVRAEQRHPRAGAPLDPLHERCRCGMNPLLAYFNSGDLALLSLADKLAFAFSEAEFDDLRAAYHAVAIRELDYFCRLCMRPSAPEPCVARAVREAAVTSSAH